MALPTTGQISISDICVELGLAPTTNISLNDSRFRKLAQKETAGSTIGMSDFYGKSNFDYTLYKTRGFQEIVGPGWNPSYGGPGLVFSECLLVIPSDPSLLLKGAVGYDSSGAEIFRQMRTAKSGNIPFNTWAAGDILCATSNASTTNISLICIVFSSISKVNKTLHRIEVIDTNGVVYDLNKHRNVSFTPGRNGAGPLIQVVLDDEKNKRVVIAPNN